MNEAIRTQRSLFIDSDTSVAVAWRGTHRMQFVRYAYLRRFPVDALKLGKSFVEDIAEDPGDATIVSAMISIGTSLNQRVIAEGVETDEQFMFLKSHKCTEGQGYYFSHPVVAEQAGRLIGAGTV